MPAAEAPPRRALGAWLEALERAHVREIDLGLERVRRVWAALGAPRVGRRVITVAGTNGKGSTVHALEALGRAHGLRTATTTSPHLQRFNERIRIDGAEASDGTIVEAFERIERARIGLAGGPVSLTYFETAILAALLIMADAGPDLAVLEVGLGGRLDAVNVVDCDLAVVTPVDLDHQAWLGSDRETIGAEKAGVLRPGCPVVISDPAPPASVLERAAALAAPVLRIGVDFACDGDRYTGAAAAGLGPCELSGLGAPRVHPAALGAALTVLRLVGTDLRLDTVRSALDGLRVPGRMQRLAHGGTELILDVAHNPHAARALAAGLPDDGPFELLFGAFADKDVEGILAPLAPRLAGITLVDTPGSRGSPALSLAERLAPLGLPALAAAGSVSGGLDRALARAGDRRVLVCGSFTVVGAVLGLVARSEP